MNGVSVCRTTRWCVWFTCDTLCAFSSTHNPLHTYNIIIMWESRFHIISLDKINRMAVTLRFPINNFSIRCQQRGRNYFFNQFNVLARDSVNNFEKIYDSRMSFLNGDKKIFIINKFMKFSMLHQRSHGVMTHPVLWGDSASQDENVSRTRALSVMTILPHVATVSRTKRYFFTASEIKKWKTCKRKAR